MATEEAVEAAEFATVEPTSAPQPAEAHHPLLSVDRSEGSPPGSRHFLIPVDDTEDSEEAINWAISMFGEGHSIFHLLHVVPEPQMLHLWAGTYIPPDENAELIEVEDTRLFVSHRFAKKLIRARIPFKLHVIVGPTDSDSVANVILKKALDVEACCIIMARHSKGRLREMWVGSVTKGAVHKSEVPVAVVPNLGRPSQP